MKNQYDNGMAQSYVLLVHTKNVSDPKILYLEGNADLCNLLTSYILKSLCHKMKIEPLDPPLDKPLFSFVLENKQIKKENIFSTKLLLPIVQGGTYL